MEISKELNPQKIVALSQKFEWSNKLTEQLLADLPKILKNESRVKSLQNYADNLNLNPLHEFCKNNDSIPETFQLFCIIAALPNTMQDYERKNIPLKYFYQIMNDLHIWANDYFKKNNRWGFDKINWITNHLKLNIFQIGAFQFEPQIFNKPFHVYLKKDTKEVMCLTSSDLLCNQVGLLIDEKQSNQQDFKTTFIEDSTQFFGHIVDKKGYVQSKKSGFLHQDWGLIAKPGGNYIAFHIPEGSKLTIDNLNASFLEANQFFAKYFPEFTYQIFGTDSWICDDQISNYLPESNIAKFQQCVHLLPIKNGNDEQFKERVFGDPKVNLDEIMPKTQLQKIGLDHIKAGKEWRKKSFVLYKNNLPLQQN